MYLRVSSQGKSFVESIAKMKALTWFSVLIVLTAVRSDELASAEYLLEDKAASSYQQDEQEEDRYSPEEEYPDDEEVNAESDSKRGKSFDVLVSDVTYHLFTKQSLTEPEDITDGNVDKLNETKFDSHRKNLFIIDCASFLDPDSKLNEDLTSAALSKNDLNVFVVDWTKISQLYEVRDFVKPIGKLVGKFIEKIQDTYNLDGSFFILIGFGLGAHVAESAGSTLKSKVDHMIALDPVWLLPGDKFEQLSTRHADFVQVIHTNSIHGITHPIGHVDFYPNGGLNQPGCLGLWAMPDHGCSHSRSFEYFAESLNPKKNFTGTECKSYGDYARGLCAGASKTLMGGLSPNKSARGKFYLRTNLKSPFARG